MVQYDNTGHVIPHYYGEDYRGYDIFLTYRQRLDKYIPIYKVRNPYDDADACDENLTHAPQFRSWQSKDEAKAWIDKYTFLSQPDLDFEARLCSSRWDPENKPQFIFR